METDSTSSKLLLVAVTAATVAVCAVLAEAEASDRRVRNTHVQSARAARLLDLWVACNTVGRVGCCCNVLRRLICLL
jgi:hypothetical protein